MTAPRRELPYTWAEVKARLQADLPRVLDRLGLRDKVSGGVMTPLNPTRNDRKPGSFVIWMGGVSGGGAWRDYATGDEGDLFALIGYVLRLVDKIDAYWWALDYLGLERGEVRVKAGAAQEAERYERDRLAREARAMEADEAKSAALLKQWLGLKEIGGTLAETYLREARGIPLERLPSLPKALRFSPALDHVDEDTGEVTSWPCMVSAMARGTKGVTALHRTWLAPDGSGKAPVAKAKKMIGPTRGSSIRLCRGEGDLSPAEAVKRGRSCPLILGEGIETTLTGAVSLPDYRAWAAGSLGLMGLLEWPPYVSGVVLLQDNDWKPEAVAAFARVEAWWRGQARGRPVKVAKSAVGSDFNDAVRG